MKQAPKQPTYTERLQKRAHELLGAADALLEHRETPIHSPEALKLARIIAEILGDA